MLKNTALLLLLGFFTCLTACGSGSSQESGVDAENTTGFVLDNGDQIIEYAISFQQSCLAPIRKQAAANYTPDELQKALSSCADSCSAIETALRYSSTPGDGQRLKTALTYIINRYIDLNQDPLFWIIVYEYCLEERFATYL